METQSYKPKTFNLSGLTGISDKTLEMHFKLYEGYVTNTNLLTEKIDEILADGKVDRRRCLPTPSSPAGSASSTTAWSCTSTTSGT